jgi:hypothetical protein
VAPSAAEEQAGKERHAAGVTGLLGGRCQAGSEHHVAAPFQDRQPCPGLWSGVGAPIPLAVRLSACACPHSHAKECIRGAFLCMRALGLGCFTTTRTCGGRAAAWGQRRILNEVATFLKFAGAAGGVGLDHAHAQAEGAAAGGLTLATVAVTTALIVQLYH